MKMCMLLVSMVFIFLSGCETPQQNAARSSNVESSMRIQQRDLASTEVVKPRTQLPVTASNQVGAGQNAATVNGVIAKGGIPLVASEVPQVLDKTSWEITDQDTNLRILLNRWGSQTSPKWEIAWQVNRDIPLAGKAVLKQPGFKSAVRYATSISSQSGFAVKPCFHTNFIVRIVAASEMCNAISKEAN